MKNRQKRLILAISGLFMLTLGVAQGAEQQGAQNGPILSPTPMVPATSMAPIAAAAVDAVGAIATRTDDYSSSGIDTKHIAGINAAVAEGAPVPTTSAECKDLRGNLLNLRPQQLDTLVDQLERPEDRGGFGLSDFPSVIRQEIEKSFISNYRWSLAPQKVKVLREGHGTDMLFSSDSTKLLLKKGRKTSAYVTNTWAKDTQADCMEFQNAFGQSIPHFNDKTGQFLEAVNGDSVWIKDARSNSCTRKVVLNEVRKGINKLSVVPTGASFSKNKNRYIVSFKRMGFDTQEDDVRQVLVQGVQIFDAVSHAHIKTFTNIYGGDGYRIPYVLSEDDSLFAYVSTEDDVIYIYDMETGLTFHMGLPSGKNSTICSMRFSSDVSRPHCLAIAFDDGTVDIYDLQLKHLCTTLKSKNWQGAVRDMAFSPNNNFLAIDFYSAIEIWQGLDFNSLQEVFVQIALKNAVTLQDFQTLRLSKTFKNLPDSEFKSACALAIVKNEQFLKVRPRAALRANCRELMSGHPLVIEEARHVRDRVFKGAPITKFIYQYGSSLVTPVTMTGAARLLYRTRGRDVSIVSRACEVAAIVGLFSVMRDQIQSRQQHLQTDRARMTQTCDRFAHVERSFYACTTRALYKSGKYIAENKARFAASVGITAAGVAAYYSSPVQKVITMGDNLTTRIGDTSIRNALRAVKNGVLGVARGIVGLGALGWFANRAQRLLSPTAAMAHEDAVADAAARAADSDYDSDDEEDDGDDAE